MAIPRSLFLEKGKMQPFVNLPIMFWLYTALQYWISMSLNFHVFHTSGGISSRPAAFLFLIFDSTTWSSSCVISLMSCWSLMISLIGSSVISFNFPRRFLKCSFHKCSCSWLAAFSLALEVFFLLLTSFTVCHVIWDCPSSTKFLILLIWSWMYCLFF